MSETVSIIVVAYNEAAHISRLGESLKRLHVPDGVRVEKILVDGGSRDDTVARARRYFDRVLEAPGASIPTCRNLGLRVAQGEWIGFLDADCEPREDWLVEGLNALKLTGAFIVGWPVEPPDPPTWVQATWHLHWSHKIPSREEVAGKAVVRHESFRLITTRNMLLRREIAEKLGGFDENLLTGEDTDLVFRAHCAGFATYGIPSLRVVHYGEPATLRQFFRQQLWHANRRSYARILGSGQRAGRHAPLFTWLFAVSLLSLILAGPVALANPILGALLALPVVILTGAPATLMAARAHRLRAIPALMVLYAAYGLARVIDLIGFAREKKSWKV